MAAATIRLGKISSINYTAGKARVVYEDRDDSVTSELPFLALQYNIPKVDDLVVVACFSNGTVSGVILGPVYNSANTPHEGGAGIFRQEMSNNVNEAVMSYSVFHKLPGASSVSPILNWQVSSTSGTKYLLIVRRLLVRLSPNVTGDTSSGVTFLVGYVVCAGAQL